MILRPTALHARQIRTITGILPILLGGDTGLNEDFRRMESAEQGPHYPKPSGSNAALDAPGEFGPPMAAGPDRISPANRTLCCRLCNRRQRNRFAEWRCRILCSAQARLSLTEQYNKFRRVVECSI